MQTTFKYGSDSEVQFELPPQALLADCTLTSGTPLDDIAAALDAAVQSPLEFPPLDQAIVPGDQVAIAVEPGIPQAAQLVAAVIHYLIDHGTPARSIAVVHAATEPSDLRAQLHSSLLEQVTFEAHDPADRNCLSYLAASEQGEAIYLNRTLLDADMVIPIGCLRPEHALGYHGIHDALFPTFSDQASLQRFRETDSQHSEFYDFDSPEPSESAPAKRAHEAQEAAWLLGILFTIQVVAGPGDSILHIFAGEPETVYAQGSKFCQAAWTYRIPQRASLVVASIAGDSSQQTWENVARALATAAQAVAENGAIALCTEIETLPGASLQRMATADDPHRMLRKITKENQPDLVQAALLAQTLDQAKVYFLSHLEEDVVEELGLAHVAHAGEVARLVQRHPSCILLANAQHAVLTVADEEPL